MGRYGRKGVPQEILDAMREAMGQGQSMEQAAQEAGISMSTAKKYRDKGMLDVGEPGKHVKEIDLTHETQFRGGTRMDGTPAAVPKEEGRPTVCEAAEAQEEPKNENGNDTKEEEDMEKWENMELDETKAETVTRMEKAQEEKEKELKNSADEKLLALRLINDVIKGMRDLEMYVEDGILVDQYAENTVKEARQSLESVRSDTFSDLVDWDMVMRTAEER